MGDKDRSTGRSRRHYVGTLASACLLASSGCVEQLTQRLPGGGPSVEEVKRNAQSVEYETLYRNIDQYRGEPVHYPRLEITDVISGEGVKEYLMMFPDGGFNDDRIFYMLWDGDPFKESDTVEVWGVVRGLETYTSLTGERTVPKVRLVDIELIEGG